MNNQQKQQEEQDAKKGLAVLPYVKNVTERVKRILQDHNIMVAVKPLNTIRSMISKPKDRLDDLKKTGVIYQIPCADCSTVYIGETKRSLKTRVSEHERCVRLGQTEKSALSDHANSLGHSVNWKDTSILRNEARWHQRKWLEAVLIAKANKNNIISNRDSGRTLPDSYIQLLKTI